MLALSVFHAIRDACAACGLIGCLPNLTAPATPRRCCAPSARIVRSAPHEVPFIHPDGASPMSVPRLQTRNASFVAGDWLAPLAGQWVEAAAAHLSKHAAVARVTVIALAARRRASPVRACWSTSMAPSAPSGADGWNGRRFKRRANFSAPETRRRCASMTWFSDPISANAAADGSNCGSSV